MSYFLGAYKHNEDKYLGLVAMETGIITFHFKFGEILFDYQQVFNVGDDIYIDNSCILNENAVTLLEIENPSGSTMQVNGETCLSLQVKFNATGINNSGCIDICADDTMIRADEIVDIQENTLTPITFSSPFVASTYVLQTAVTNGFGSVGYTITNQTNTGFEITTMIGAGVSTLKYIAVKKS